MFQKYIVFSDSHFPFNDPRLINKEGGGLILDIAESVGVTDIIMNGDIYDFYWFGQYEKSRVVTTLEDELEITREFFYKLRERFKRQRIVFLGGNHENRLNRFLMSIKCPLSFQDKLALHIHAGFDHLNIEHYPYQFQYCVVGTNLKIFHSPPSYAKLSPANTSLNHKMSGAFIWGCTHRPDSGWINSDDGKSHEAHILGWLGSTSLTDDHEKVFSYTKGHERWGTSFALVYVYSNYYYVQHIVIKDYGCVVEGVYYQA